MHYHLYKFFTMSLTSTLIICQIANHPIVRILAPPFTTNLITSLSRTKVALKNRNKPITYKMQTQTLLLLSLFFVAAIGAPLALPHPQEAAEPPRCKSQLNYLLCLETCVLPGTVECPDRCCEHSSLSLLSLG